MPEFRSFDGCTISYRDQGQGPLVVLLHGSLVDAALNWELSGVIPGLAEAGFHVVAPDARGHGMSAKPHDPAAYANDAMVRDVVSLIDHLDAERVALVGYSMGADTAMRVAARDRRIVALVAGGVGGELPDGYDASDVAVAIRGFGVEEPSSQIAASLAELAHSMGGDVEAFAALFEGEAKTAYQPPAYDEIACPTLVLAGADDDMAGGSPEDVARRLPSATAITIEGQDHLGAVFDPAFISEVTEFLRARVSMS